jgi:hypothetical protein
MRLRTWMIERAVVAAVLSTVTLATRGAWTSWLCVAAVTLSFAHGQVADRLAEREAARPVPAVACHAKAGRYFVMKEALWAAFFLTTAAYPALVGVALFLAYPVWRRWWRRHYPMT